MVDEFQFKLCEKDGVGFHLNMQDNTISRGSLAGFLHVEGCRVCGDLFKHYELPDGTGSLRVVEYLLECNVRTMPFEFW